MKKTYKIVMVLLFVILTLFCTNVFAAKVNITAIVDDDTNVAGQTEIKDIGSYILSAVTGVGIVVSVVIVAIIGLKYMMGSAEERAEYKKSMMPYIIGAFLLFGASAIAQMVINVVS